MKLSTWGRLTSRDYQVLILDEPLSNLSKRETQFLPFGACRSYGDVALLSAGLMVSTSALNKFLEINQEEQTVCAQAGINFSELEEILNLHQLSLPVRPGTAWLTLGGAIANDIHGKNHHVKGSFGCHLVSMKIWRSDSGMVEISPTQNPELFYATIGGLGLTGAIIEAKFRVEKFLGQTIEAENFAFANLKEFAEISESSHNFQSSVSWIAASGKKYGRGIFTRGNVYPTAKRETHCAKPNKIFTIPSWPGPSLVNKYSTNAFNNFYFHSEKRKGKYLLPANKYYFPLDRVSNWNTVYGPKGFFQYQSVVPEKNAQQATEEMLAIISRSGESSFLTVLKTFGDMLSGGLLSFPMPGWTLAIDFPNRGEKSLMLFNKLDNIVKEAGGRIYLAKDARMKRELFEETYPNLAAFEKLRDPKISSDLAKRLMGW